ncbi:plant cysteine oxidase 3-like [Dendrobium catenatum]|uniref:plant cysteine oxidase 3-like n=1 Tax=Dendrobium catenatum TaxID=906689 RepID=UPI00109FBCD6|nr:plant cysteine oxidase 3-like [Dendrobium catenatum]
MSTRRDLCRNRGDRRERCRIYSSSEGFRAGFAAEFVDLPRIPVKLAKYQADTVLTAPCPTRVLYPKTGGNLHCFTAITSVAVLDVLAPPYSEVAGRRCTYYHDYPYSTFSTVKELEMDEREEDYSWLEAIDAPDDLYMRSGKYSGPPVKQELSFPGFCTIA